MPPVMNRTNSRARAERAWRLRVRGKLWREVAAEEGYRSERSAQRAVEDFLRRTPPTDVETLRRAMGEGLTMIREAVLDSMDAAQAKGDHRGVAQLGQVAADTIDKQAKLYGLHIAVPTVVDVTVHQSPAEMLAEVRSRLMAAIDAEVVEVIDVPFAETKAVGL
jgi:hypothetical protein